MPTTNRRVARRGMIAAALAIAAGLCLTFCGGCGQGPTAATEEWSAEYESEWQKVIACWKSKGLDTRKARRPGVIVRGDCRSYWSKQDYCIGGNEWRFGRYFPGSNEAEVCPDLSALTHEMSHALLATAAGSSGENGTGGCFSVTQ